MNIVRCASLYVCAYARAFGVAAFFKFTHPFSIRQPSTRVLLHAVASWIVCLCARPSVPQFSAQQARWA